MKAALILIVLFISNSMVWGQDSTVSKEPNNKKQIQFLDEDGDGYNDLAPDHDGDGIPNGLDPDYEPSQSQHRHQFTDLNGNGIDDTLEGDDREHNRQRVGEENQIDDPSSGQGANKKQKRKGRM